MTGRAVLALDLGTHAGWALRWADGRIESGAMNFSPAGSDHEGLRFLRFRAWLHDTKRRVELAGEAIVEIVYEAVDFVMAGQAYSAHVWGALWGTVTAWAAHHGIPCRGISPGTIKHATTGSGRAKKPEMVAAIRKRGFNPLTHDEADAIAILLMTPAIGEAA